MYTANNKIAYQHNAFDWNIRLIEHKPHGIGRLTSAAMNNQIRNRVLFLASLLSFVNPSRLQPSQDISFIADVCETTALCVVDETPSQVVPLNQTVLFAQSTCNPRSVICVSECRKAANCTNFNYRSDEGICELFYRTPIKYSSSSNCTHFRVSCITTHCSLDAPE